MQIMLGGVRKCTIVLETHSSLLSFSCWPLQLNVDNSVPPRIHSYSSFFYNNHMTQRKKLDT